MKDQMLHNGLPKLIEEASEMLVIAGKMLNCPGSDIHWDGQSLSKRLTEEMGDALAAIEFCSRKLGLDSRTIHLRQMHKLRLYHQWDTEIDSKKENVNAQG